MKLKRIASGLVAAVMAFAVLGTPLGDILPFVRESVATTAGAEVYSKPVFREVSRTQEEVYNSDLFYGYSFYLSKSPYLLGYSSDTFNLFNNVCQDYIDSPNFFWTNFSYSIPLVFDLKSYIKNLSDAVGVTTFTYENALDAANQEFANKLLGDKTDLASQFGKSKKWIKTINNVAKVYDTFQKNYDVVGLSDEEIIEHMFVTINDTNVFEFINETQITSVKVYILPKISDITKSMSYGADALTAAKCIVMGLAMEDMRFGIIQEILNSQTKNTMLYDGMERLNKQLRNNFSSYFIDNYLKGKVLDFISDKIIKEMQDDLIEGEYQALYKLIGACVNLANWIVFDKIFDVPSVDDVTTALVLREYANDFYNLTQEKINKFQKQFTIHDIERFQQMFDAWICATNAAFDACDKLTLSSNKQSFITIKNKYRDADIYTNVLEQAKLLVKSIPFEERVVYIYDAWSTPENVDFTICNGSDEIEENTFYYITNSYIPKNFTVSEKATLHLDCDINIDKLTFCVFSKIEKASEQRRLILGKLELNISGYYHDDVDVTFNNYEMYLDSDLNINGKIYPFHWAVIRLNHSKLYIKGDLYLGQAAYLYIQNGSSVFTRNLMMTCGSECVTAIYVDDSKFFIYGNAQLQGVTGFYRSDEPELHIQGSDSHVEIFGDLKITGLSRSDKLILDDGDLYLHGDFINDNVPYESLSLNKGNGMIHLCGEQVQKVKNIVFGSHLDISNINGVSLLSDTYIYGYTKINSGRIYLNGYRFLFSWGAIFNATSQYGDLKIYDLDSNIQNVYLDEAAVPRKSNEITYTITADDKTHTLVIIMKNGTISTNTVTLLTHKCVFGDWSVDSASKCNSIGKAVRSCTLCQKKEYKEIPLVEHTFGEWQTTVKPTCTEGGEMKRSCSVCGAEETKTIDALGHDYSEQWTVDEEADCVNDGSKSRHCSRCDAKTDVTVIEAKGHTEVVDKAVAATCTADGYTEGKHCSVCNAVIVAQEKIAATGHKYVETVVEPSYSNRGYTLYECSVCGYSYKDNYEEQLIVPAVTGFASGSQTKSSAVLGWDKVSDADGYAVELYTGGKWNEVFRTSDGSVTSCTVGSLKADSIYTLRIRAFKDTDDGTVCSDYARLAVKTKLAGVTGLKAQGVTATAVKLDWARNAGATGYIIEQYKGGKWTQIAVTKNNYTLTFTVKGLAECTPYSFRVKAYKNDGGKTNYSDYVTVKASTLLGTVKNAKVTSTTGTWITLGWDRNAGATGYVLEQYKGGRWTEIAVTKNNTTLKFTVKGLRNDTTYSFRIKAYKTVGDTTTYGSYVRAVGTTDIPNVAKFTGSAVSASAVKLNWSKNDKATGYVIEQYKGGRWTEIKAVDNDVTEITVEGLAKGTAYTFRIKSVKTVDGADKSSEYASVKVKTAE